MKAWLRFLMLPLVFVPACSWFNPPQEQTVIAPPPKITHYTSQRNRVTTREVGSLWSEDSNWNVMYSPTQTRVPGDIVTLKLDPKFRARLESTLKRPGPKEEEKVEKEKTEKKEGENKTAANEGADRQPAAIAPMPLAGNKVPPPPPSLFKTPETLEVTILEALPRGAYRVSANHGLKVTEDSPYVYIQGVLREREIGGDDTAQAMALLDLQFEPIDRDKKIDSTQKLQERK